MISNIIDLEVMDPERLDDVVIQDTKAIMLLNKKFFEEKFEDFEVENLSWIMLSYIEDLGSLWKHLQTETRFELVGLIRLYNGPYKTFWQQFLKSV